MNLCIMENCGKPVKAKKYCAMHHQRWRRHGDPNTIKVRKSGLPGICQWVNCNKPTLCKGYCTKHYYIHRMMKIEGAALPSMKSNLPRV